jgi:hypothetical protein
VPRTLLEHLVQYCRCAAASAVEAELSDAKMLLMSISYVRTLGENLLFAVIAVPGLVVSSCPEFFGRGVKLL